MQNNELAVDELMKGECYRFLAACFYQPKKEILVAEQLLPTLVSNLLQVCPAAAPFAQSMQESLASYTEEELTVEYARLFVGPFGVKAPPYGSIYLDNDHTVMGPSTIETIAFYEQEGLARDKDFHELPDHIAVELEFMYFLIYRQAEALQKGDMTRAEAYRIKQEQFRTRFLGNWVPPFCTHIHEETDNEFYSSLADCLSALVTGAYVQEVPPHS
jgi:DMSO reductase family type II enzyme chaperone